MSKIDLKVVLLGKQFGGKTSLAERFLNDKFTGESFPYQNTIGAAFGAKKMLINHRQITLGLWDTAGSERYESMSRIYYRGAGAAIICYDLTDDSSFDRARFWVNELRKHEEKCSLYLCGTKIDLIANDKSRRKVDYHLTTDYADEIQATVFETSSKTGEGVGDLFLKISEDYIRRNPKYEESSPSSLRLLNAEPLKQSTCCLTA